MSSGFVSAGGEEVKPRDGLSEYDKDAWEKARQKIEELKKPKPVEPGTQEGGLSLYEHLQAQKAAKQEAFEEATKLRNQFRPLDDGEVAFLESIKLKEEAKARAEREETQEQLAKFRREREEAEEKARELEASQEASGAVEEVPAEKWIANKKRRRAKDDEKVAASKSLKTSTSIGNEAESAVIGSTTATASNEKLGQASRSDVIEPNTTAKAPLPQTAAMKSAILVTYDSDSDD